jgi:hypothetical protein
LLHKDQIADYLNALNDELKQNDIKGEICLYGGAVMCLVYDARPSTKDIDAIFHPSRLIREAAQKVAQKFNLSSDWLNDGVKGFVVEHQRTVIFDLSNLSVYTPEPEYILAMKLLASRVDGMDNTDIRFLIKKLQIKTAEETFAVIQKYYPKNIIKPASQFFIEEIFDEK